MMLQKNKGAVRRFSYLSKLAQRLQNIPNKITPAPFRLLQIGSAFWQSRALYVAAKLNIATVLGNESLSSDDIASRVCAQPEAMYRLLRMLSALGIFQEISPCVFANNRLSNPLRDDSTTPIRAMILMHNSEPMSRPWYQQLEHSVCEGGIPFRQTHGADLYDYMDQHPEFDTLFAQAMSHVEALSGDSFVHDFNWGYFERIIDIGGSQGSKSAAILKHYPQLTALVVDRASVIAQAQAYWATQPSTDWHKRLNFAVGDVLTSIPMATSAKDIYLLCAVFHGFDDHTCLQALRQLARVCQPTHARVALMEIVMAEFQADAASTAFDMQMFMGTGGKERTLTEWQRLFEDSGFMLEELVHLQSFAKILVLVPKA